MNVIQPKIQAPPPQAQPNQAKPENNDRASTAPSKAFAAAMDNASAKPAKKTTPNKTSNGAADGKPLPVAGNQAPPVAVASPQAIPGNPGLRAVTDSAATTQPVSVNATPLPLSGPVAGQASAPDTDDSVKGADMVEGNYMANGDETAAPTATAPQAKANILSGLEDTGAQPDSPTGAVLSQPGSMQPSAAPSSAVQPAANDAGPAPTFAAQLGAAPVSSVQPDVAAATVSMAVAPKLPVGPITGNAHVATLKSDILGVDGADGAHAATNAPPDQSDLSAVAANNASGSLQTSDAGAAAMAATISGVATQNSVSSADSAVSATTGTPMGADAATIADATASATAAVAASATRVITELASTTATDKRSRGTDAVSGAAPTSGSDGTVGTAQAMSVAPTTSNTDAAASPTFKVGPGVDSSEFGQSVAHQLTTMLGNNISSAKLSVNPPSLGPIEVRIAVQGDQAQISMMSHSAVTRDALHDSTPQLRAMLNSQGFAQVSVDISQRSFQERAPTPQTYEWNSGADRSDHSTGTTAASAVTRSASGALDAYA